jgi:hypothetical protein
MLLTSCLSLALGIAAAAAAATPPDPPAQKGAAAKSREVVEAWYSALVKDAPPEATPTIAAVDDAVVCAAFPDDHFYALRFMRYPRAVLPPVTLNLENLVRVRANGTVERIESVESLKKLFKPRLAAATEAQARTALPALLRLAEEFYQDGRYAFEMSANASSVTDQNNAFTARATAEVTKGGRGTVTVSFTTGKEGKIEVNGKVRPDARPR